RARGCGGPVARRRRARAARAVAGVLGPAAAGADAEERRGAHDLRGSLVANGARGGGPGGRGAERAARGAHAQAHSRHAPRSPARRGGLPRVGRGRAAQHLHSGGGRAVRRPGGGSGGGRRARRRGGRAAGGPEDLYAVLGGPGDADEAEIKKAYRRLAMQHHPDRVGGGPDEKHAAEERFKEITEAYEVLRDPEKRALYDRYGARGVRRGGGGGGGGAPDFGFAHFDLSEALNLFMR